MSSDRTVFSCFVNENSTFRYDGQVVDELGAAIPSGSLTTLVLTLYALDAAETVISGLNCTDIKNTGRGAVDASGNLAVTFLSSDAMVLDPTQNTERRVGLFHWTFGVGPKHKYKEIEFTIQNLHKVCNP